MDKIQNKQQTPEEIFEYFKELSEIFGKKENQTDGNGQTQENFSVSWFFNNTKYEDLNDLTRTFLDKRLSLNSENRVPKLHLYDLNDNQKEAIKTALVNPVTIVHGPPGTGKTKTIISLIKNIIRLDKKTAAVISCNKEAIKNIEDDIKNGDDEELIKKTAFLGDFQKRQNFNEKHRDGDFKFQNKEDNEIGRITSDGWPNGRKKEGKIRAEEFTKEYPIITSTIHSLLTCFKDGIENGKVFQYDYVIIDEASQVSINLGIIALSAAKHIVIVGDEKQLSPIIRENVKVEINQIEQKLPGKENETYKQTEDNSFLTACLKRKFKFNNGEKIKEIMLTEHYRCHPGIIGFCNKYIYNDKLNLNPVITIEEIRKKIATINIDCPFRIVYYNGDYSERCLILDKKRISKRNRKQISILFKEELQELKKKIDAEKSICILAPYVGQIKEIEEKLKENGIEYCTDDTDNDVQILTIHKTQGKQFDVVYFLPVDDGSWEWPWSQKSHMINVAVSRAREEMIIITSTNIMPAKIQKELCGKEESSENTKKIEIDTNAAENKDNLLLHKLIQYVYDHYEKGKHQLKEYGFHKSNIKSVFDNLPDDTTEGSESKHEEALKRVLEDICCKTGCCFEQQVELKTIPASHDNNYISNEEASFMYGSPESPQNAARYDFLIKYKEEPLLAIEVDEVHHRSGFEKPTTRTGNSSEYKALIDDLDTESYKDKMKDDISEKMKLKLLRLPTDGSNDKYEEDLIMEKIDVCIKALNNK